MSTVEQQIHTPEDLLHMPDGDRFELVDGELVETEKGGKSSWIAGQVFAEIQGFARQHGGWAFPSATSYQCFEFAPEMVRRPDASFVCAGRFDNDEIPGGHIRIPPDLAVEVVSPNDLYTRVEDKVDEYLRAGVRLVWVVNPAHRTVRVFSESIARSIQFGPDEELTAADVLPGFCCRIADLFEKPAGSDASRQ